MSPGGRLGWWFVGFMCGLLVAILAGIVAVVVVVGA